MPRKYLQIPFQSFSDQRWTIIPILPKD